MSLRHACRSLTLLVVLALLVSVPTAARAGEGDGSRVVGPGVTEVAVPRRPAPAESSDQLADDGAALRKPVPEDVEDLRAIEKRIRKLVDRVTECTVAVTVGSNQGSGVIVSEDGYVLTAAHVVGSANRPTSVTLADGRRLRAESLGVIRDLDAGMVKIVQPGRWPFVPVDRAGTGRQPAKSDEQTGALRVGNWCIAMGHPGGYRKGRQPVLRLGRIVATGKTVIQTDCTLVGGDSGGPLFDLDGRIIGIHSRIGTPTSWNFHAPITSFRENWERLSARQESSDSAEAVLGIDGEDHEQGCRITTVADGFPAAEAGLQPGDVITTFDGEKVDSFEALRQAVLDREPGDEVRIEILREDRMMKKTVALGRRPSM